MCVIRKEWCLACFHLVLFWFKPSQFLLEFGWMKRILWRGCYAWKDRILNRVDKSKEKTKGIFLEERSKQKRAQAPGWNRGWKPFNFKLEGGAGTINKTEKKTQTNNKETRITKLFFTEKFQPQQCLWQKQINNLCQLRCKWFCKKMEQQNKKHQSLTVEAETWFVLHKKNHFSPRLALATKCVDRPMQSDRWVSSGRWGILAAPFVNLESQQA